jgi:hypothetical protein
MRGLGEGRVAPLETISIRNFSANCFSPFTGEILRTYCVEHVLSRVCATGHLLQIPLHRVSLQRLEDGLETAPLRLDNIGQVGFFYGQHWTSWGFLCPHSPLDNRLYVHVLCPYLVEQPYLVFALINGKNGYGRNFLDNALPLISYVNTKICT